MKKRIDIICSRFVNTEDKVLFRQSVLIDQSLKFDYQAVESVLRCLFPGTEFVTFKCADYE